MKKTILGLLSLALLFGLGGITNAAVSAITPSTNDINKTKGWAHVNQLSQNIGETRLQFVSTRPFSSCFEYRTDGDTSQKKVENNPNTAITDGLYPWICVDNTTTTKVIKANEYVEVRMVFGTRKEERFGWTRFDVLLRPGTVVSPTAGKEITRGSTLRLEAHDVAAKSGTVQWAVKKSSCASTSATVAGNIDGFNNSYKWEGGVFTASVGTSNLSLGEYCFLFNPSQGGRLTRLFKIVAPASTNPAPIVTILSPKSGDKVSGTVHVRATIKDSDLSHYNIALYKAGANVNNASSRLIHKQTSASEFTNQVVWSFNSKDFANGDYQIRLVAQDRAGNSDLSNPNTGGNSSVHVIQITINNTASGSVSRTNPTAKEHCMKNGWSKFKFKNQGQCIRFVQTRKDSR
jgi:hypothetical protein